MYKTGHYGVSMLVYAPVGFALVTAGYPGLALVAGAAVLWLATLPDVDHRLPLVAHRGITHTVFFAAFVGAAFAVPVALVGSNTSLLPGALAPAFAFVVGAFGILGHLLGDVITPMGVKFFHPVSSASYSLNLTTADSTLWNYGLFVAGVFATAVAAALAFGIPT